MTKDDINVRIEKRIHKKLKITAVKYGLTLKQVIGIMANNKGFEHTLKAVINGDS